MLYVVFSLFGAYGDVEVHAGDGRVDLVMVLWDKLYLIETKLDRSAGTAMEQIELKDYAERFSLLNLPVVKIGINFSTKERGITDWKVELST
ncbi:MAG: PD-(D/E)XK nuclease domain-containing protein [Bacteroidales bacterium]|nr:PD-(D/E)XK nuclease domain-containing protein [Bacteroidales bacterium]MCM1146590.1 PD-(D/E)XK nuclease domain-containing protein [Bacteroidales bacterium]MCM1205982.1 PD-(D/E)XK nuclease domain-containing protein [Bacillota bacterium]MCM1510137.1 PD-(D/E)XK nuclease domain-containing protein [Clostridium sp.]